MFFSTLTGFSGFGGFKKTVQPTLGLVLYYNPDDPASYPGSGNTVFDLSGNGLDGTMSNVSYTDPYFTFSQASSSQISVADNALLNPGSGNFSIEMWYYVNSFNPASTDTLISKVGPVDLGYAQSYSIDITTSNVNPNQGTIRGRFGTGTPGQIVDTASFTINKNIWYQVVVVYSTVESKYIALYQNGSSNGNIPHNKTSVPNQNAPLYIGNYNGSNDYAPNVLIGVVRIYNTALSSAQVLTNYNNTKSIYGL